MSQAEISITWPTMVKFVRQLSHDLRNHLNAIELQAAYLGEIIVDAEAKSELQRLRAMTAEMGTQLQQLTATIAQPPLQTMPYKASEFVEDLRAKLERDDAEKTATIEWQTSLANETLEIDPQLLQQALVELFTNARIHQRAKGPLTVNTQAQDGEWKFVLREPKAGFDQSTESWGTQPLQKIGQGHYGLGLHRARSIVEAHHGTLRAQFDPAESTLTTTVALPLSTEE
jgi:light-regulated signal transduction histidine kinase (bacteriophytochrome)